MKCVLVTGATGNVGSAVIRSLIRQGGGTGTGNASAPPAAAPDSAGGLHVIALVRDVDRARRDCPDEWRTANVQFRRFDFEDAATFDTALIGDGGEGVDALFLLRPPHLTSMRRVFRPLLDAARAAGVGAVVFLSVQGVEKSSMIPHHKIEREIRGGGRRWRRQPLQQQPLPYVFLRPSYFMQNMTTTLRGDIVGRDRRIFLPAGDARFNWVDIDDVAEVAAVVISRFDEFRNTALDVTGSENETFETVASLIRDVTGADDVRYESVGPLRYVLTKRQEGEPMEKILVLTMLHYVARFQRDDEPVVSDIYQRITGKPPTTLREFLEREKLKFVKEQV